MLKIPSIHAAIRLLKGKKKEKNISSVFDNNDGKEKKNIFLLKQNFLYIQQYSYIMP